MPPAEQRFASRSAIALRVIPGRGVTTANPATSQSGQKWELVAREFVSAQKWNCAAIRMITRHNARVERRDIRAGMYFI
jgi:hypothetical protein